MTLDSYIDDMNSLLVSFQGIIDDDDIVMVQEGIDAGEPVSSLVFLLDLLLEESIKISTSQMKTMHRLVEEEPVDSELYRYMANSLSTLELVKTAA